MKLIRTEEFTHPRKVAYVAKGTAIELNSGQWLEIIIANSDDDLCQDLFFAQGPPPGKRWDVYINLSVIERDE